MIKFYVDGRLSRAASKETIFELEEMLEYFRKVFEVRFFENLPPIGQEQHSMEYPQTTTIRIFDRKMLLDELVDYLVTSLNRQLLK